MGSELRQALRILCKNPGFAVSAILILGLGCAATTTIFSVAYGILLRDLPYDQPERLVSLGSHLPKAGFSKAYAGAADYFDWRKRQQVFEDIALTRAIGNYNLTGTGEPERLLGARATASLFSTLRATPLIGRTFTEEDQLDPRRAASVVVLSYGLWQRRFGGDPAMVGRKIRLNGSEAEILGVMRPDFRYPSREFELWTPLYYPPEELRDRMDFSYLCVGRLRPGVTLEQARAQMDVIGANLAREYPRTNKDVGVYVEPMLGQITETVRPALWLLLAAVGTLFLVGSVNLANLMLARATGRQSEFAIRGALGATRIRLVRQSFVETIPLAAAGAALGILAASWLLKLVIPLLPPGLPRVEEIAIQGPVLLFTILLSAIAALAISAAPAIQVSASLQRGPSSKGRMHNALMSAEIAGTVVLLVAAGLLMRSFVNVRGRDPGFDATGVLTLHLAVDRATHGAEDRDVARYLARLIDRVQSVPGIQSAGIVNRLPLGGQVQTLMVEFEGRDTPMNIDSLSASPDYFRTLGIPILAGRTFRNDDTGARTPIGIIDDRVAEQVFGHENPIGKRFRIPIVPGMPWVQIAGVARHIHDEALDSDRRPQVYWPYWQRTQDRMAMVVKTAGDPASMTAAVRGAIREVDRDQPLYDVRPMSEVVRRTLIGQRLNVVLLGSFAALALLLASLGLYGVVSHLTARRSREFGVRLAVGATPADLLGMVLRQSFGRAVFGLTGGLLLSALVARLLGGRIHGVTALDPITYGSVAILLLSVVLAASYLPARRASRTDPMTALRQE
jgi:putative ABC transport system permease protein